MEFLKRNWEIPLFVAFIIFAITFAEVDLWLTQFFYEPGVGFPLNDNSFVQFVYVVFRYMPAFLLPLFIILLIAPKFIKSLQGTRRTTSFLLLVLLIGPGIIVHPILKDNWDRPRPRDVQQFAGAKDFVPAFIPADQPGKNQSFASGHGAMGFYFMVFAWVFRKRRWLVAGLAIGAVVSMGRIVQGGHFASDVIAAGFIVYFTCRVLSLYMLGHADIKPKLREQTSS